MSEDQDKMDSNGAKMNPCFHFLASPILQFDFDHYDVKSPMIAGLIIGLLSDDPTCRILRLCNA